MKLKFLQPLIILMSALSLSACQSFIGCSQDDVRCFKPHRSSIQQQPSTLNPEFNYMRMMLNGQVAWLAQGATDVWSGMPQDVYYSADRNVFKWSQGRLNAVEHSAFSWREYELPVIDWQQVLQQPSTFTRQLDLADGTLAVEEQRELKTSVAPKHHAFIGDSSSLTWVHERTIQSQATHMHFDSWYAFQPDGIEPIYGQQCISHQHCLTWQKWNITQHETIQQK